VIEAAGGVIFAYYNDPAFQQPMVVTLNADADPASRKVVLDPNKMDAKGSIAIDWVAPSPDGSKLAASLSLNGSEDGTLHVYDVASGREIETPIPHVQYPTAGGSVAWTPDGQGFWYTRFPGEEAAEAERHFNQQAYFHRLGSDWKADPLVLGTKDGLPRTAEVFLDNRYNQPAALASVQKGDGNEWQHYVLRPGQPALKVGTYEDDIKAATLGPDGALYGVSRKGAPNGKVVRLAAPYTGGFAAAKTIVPEGKVAILSDLQTQSLALTRDRLFVREIDGGPTTIRVFDHQGGGGASLPVPPVADIDQMAPMPNGDLLMRVTTYLQPRTIFRWRAADGAMQPTALAVTSPIRTDDLTVTRAFATSKDGTKVPLNIVAKKGTKLDGSHPLLLEGYGGYGVSSTPVFLGALRRLWLDAGGVYVEANIRGGGEYGERWHQEGMLTKKQNVFDDFVASAQHLIAEGYTSKSKLALIGGSNGGLLMGAVITQHPDLAKAVVSTVGIYDMVRVELDPNGEFNTTEFGTVKDAAQFKALYAYSPYHHVRKGVAYPAVFMLTGANDGRVNPMHSRKFTAALQAAGGGGPILLRTSSTSGHGIGSSLDERIAQQADELAFLFDQLGMK
jgi:prolyl oligopeptidase